jgi:putative membrane protein
METFNKIPLHMNVMVVFFSVLPFLVLLGISFAKKQKYKLHFISQGFVIVISVLVLLYFEIMIRLDGGFFEFAKQSSMSHDFLVKYLIFHVSIALIATILWIMIFVKSMILYQSGKLEEIKQSNHKKMGIITFVFLLLSCVTGIFLYLFLFIF